MKEIQIAFGPQQQYVLTIPVTDDTRAALLKQFQAAASALAVKPEKNNTAGTNKFLRFANNHGRDAWTPNRHYI